MTITLLNSSSGVDGQVTLEGVHTFDPTWVIGPSTGNAPLLGGPADDILVGGSGNDVLYGFSGSDSLVGGWAMTLLLAGPETM
jgi:Ca2+-binding RTX toxin-like protein